jgi:hypothetical protein
MDIPEMYVDPVTGAQIETDGRKVWVNNPICLARFCPVSAEVFPKMNSAAHEGYLFHTTTHHTGALEWADFVQAVKTHHDIIIPDVFRPTYTKAN